MQDSAQETSEFQNFAVARQAIFEASGKTYGYELLYRNFDFKPIDAANFNDMATIDVLAHGIELAASAVAPEKKLFVNFPRSLLEKNVHAFLDKQRYVLEILESDVIDAGYLELISRIRTDGFSLALDDYAGEPVPPEVFGLVDIVKIDLLLLQDEAAVKKVIEDLGPSKLKILAEKVETLEMYNLCHELGCALFQGFYFCKPTVLKGKALSASEATKINLIAEINKPEFDFDKLSGILANDAILTYKLLKYINSPVHEQSRKIENIERAVTVMGQNGIRQWLSVNILSSLSQSDRDRELVFLSALRGKFLTMFHQGKHDTCSGKENVCLIGLFSLLDTLLKTPMLEIVKEINVEKRVKKALTDLDAPCRRCLKLSASLEHGDKIRVDKFAAAFGLKSSELHAMYLEAYNWTLEIFRH